MAEMNEQEQQSKEPIRSDMIVRDVILAHPDAAEVLMRVGMGCISCPAALMENLGDACMVHGLDGEEVVKYLNQELNLPQADRFSSIHPAALKETRLHLQEKKREASIQSELPFSVSYTIFPEQEENTS